jgi:deoxyribodipyrimidine photo-lyase
MSTRAQGLARLHEFLPRAGLLYARDRNTDAGPADRANISGLSPFLRRRLITEEEVVQAALARHGRISANKFIEEIFWRTYWKGFLEARPHLWTRYQEDLGAQRRALESDGVLAARLQRALDGATGIDCFDAWIRELHELGWLHNHARMWFASIWIFTLRLPWQLGAAHFLEHLTDADPASNTLSWRWVAGLQTKGKNYLARAENIRLYTAGRFDPRDQLDERAAPLPDDGALGDAMPLPPRERLTERRVALLLTEEDLHAESWRLEAEVIAIAGLAEGSQPARPPVAADRLAAADRFAAEAMADGLERAASHFRAPAQQLAPEEILAWVASTGARELVTAYAPVGPIAEALASLRAGLQTRGVRLVELRRAWDEQAWPHATKSFAKVREQIPGLVESLVRGGPELDSN